MEWRTLCLVLFCCLAGNLAQDLKCLLITPGVLRVDTKETFVVTGHRDSGYSSRQDGEIQIWDFPKKTIDLARGKLTISEHQGDILGTVRLTIESSKLQKEPDKKQYVTVNLKLGSCNLEKVVLVSYQSGYVFIQTDKPIYTPESTVYFRLFTMSPSLDPVSKPVIVEFLTPDNVVVQKDEIRKDDSSGIISHSYKLKEPVSTGIWSISAKYQENPTQNYTTHFEVKEYVLPSLEITLQPHKQFFHYKDNDFKVDVLANYVYGKDVEGVAFILFGIRKGEKYISLTESLKRIQINDGKGEATLERTHIMTHFSNDRDMIGCTLHLQVTVMTDTGSDILEAEMEDIHIVEFPYTVVFTRTSKHFKPGMPFDLNVLVTNPDGSPASRVRVATSTTVKDIPNTEGTTSTDGKTKLSINTPVNLQSLPITVSTKDPDLEDNQQAKASMTATAYRSNSGKYLHISILSGKVTAGDNIEIQFATNDKGSSQSIKNIFYLVLNKGRILYYKKIEMDGRPVFKELMQITGDHLPSFRVVGYFVIGNDIVADSLWFNVKEDCVGKLELEPNSNADRLVQSPSSNMKLKLTADHKAYVGLVAVDKAVYALNNKFRLTQNKVWNWIEKYDPGCTTGSGADTSEVFYDAGLVLDTNVEVSTAQRTELFCKSPETKKRRRRDTAMLLQLKLNKAADYKDQEKTCCMDGMKENPMGYSCERRSNFIDLGQKCIDAFLDCCKYMEAKRQQAKKETHSLDRSYSDDYFDDDDDVVARTYFPESFLWETKFMEKETEKGLSATVVNVYLPDSITTWEVMAVSLSKGKGICVSKPYEIVVLKQVFLDLKVPYSVVRNEQIEIRAIVYNYGNSRIKAKIVWAYNEHFCSRSTNKKNYQETKVVDPLSSVAVPFVIIPLELGYLEVEVKASGDFSPDRIIKKLLVVPEGTKQVIRNAVILDPEKNPAGRQEVNFVPSVDTKRVVPHTSIQTIVTVQGTPISDMVHEAINGINLNHLINLPEGCGEQIMAKMTSCVIATYFLDTTNQWEQIGLDRRAQAIQHIMSGISREVSYRKSDASFTGYGRSTSSTWLTAYVSRIFAMANTLTGINKENLCPSVKWLIFHKQKPDGVFEEHGTLFATYMRGGIDADSTDSDSTLTAFVLIALLDCKDLCSSDVNNLESSITKAYTYIKEKYRSLQTPYSVAITSYALAKANQLDNLDTLMSKATDGNQWIIQGNWEGTIEATSYALLTLLKKNEYKKAEPLVNWLTGQRFYGKFEGATQATIMMFQALAEYQIAQPSKKDTEMNVLYTLPGRSKASTYRIKSSNAIVARSELSQSSGNFKIVADGTGKGLLTVTTLYYEIKTEEELECKNFYLNVTVKDEPSGYCRTGHRKHNVCECMAKKVTKSTVSINVCTRYLGPGKPGMSIIEISMMSGFSARAESLDRLKNGVDKYISEFEINKAAYDKSTVVIYVDKISNTEDFCISFLADQEFDVGNIQPASVTVYEYYAKENRCTKFYHVDASSSLLSKICHKDVCRCAEHTCYRQQQFTRVTAQDRYDDACKPGVDYVYVTTLTAIEKTKGNFNTYKMTIKTIIKIGTDVVSINDKRDFVSHARCEKALNLKIGEDYLIWGLDKDMWAVTSEYFYMITKDSWVELWPNTRQCQEDRQYERICEELNLFADELQQQGCDA